MLLQFTVSHELDLDRRALDVTQNSIAAFVSFSNIATVDLTVLLLLDSYVCSVHTQ